MILRVDTPASPYSLVSKADIKTPADLKGRTVSLDGPKGITRAYFDRVMKPTGLKEGDFDLVFQGATPARFAALQSGVADAAMLTAPFDSFAEAQGFKQLVLVDNVVKDIPFGVTVGNRPWVLAHKDVVLRFFAAYREAVDWFYDPKNRAEAVQIGLRNTKQKAGRSGKGLRLLQPHRVLQQDRHGVEEADRDRHGRADRLPRHRRSAFRSSA